MKTQERKEIYEYLLREYQYEKISNPREGRFVNGICYLISVADIKDIPSMSKNYIVWGKFTNFIKDNLPELWAEKPSEFWKDTSYWWSPHYISIDLRINAIKNALESLLNS